MIRWRFTTEGRNRFVLLTRRRAIKFPSLRCWRDFLFGLLNNLNEADFCHDHPARCPVIWHSPLGLLLIMPRAEPITAAEFAKLELPPGTWAELKSSSWGKLNGRTVATDYGWPAPGVYSEDQAR